MKMNSTGEYLQEEGSVYAEDTESDQKIIYYEDKSQRMVIRSVFEEDAYKIAQKQKMNNREKNWLLKEFSKRVAIEKYFLIEDLENFQKDGTRVILGTLNLLNERKGEVCIYIKPSVDPRLAEIMRRRVELTLDNFCSAVDKEILITIFRPK